MNIRQMPLDELELLSYSDIAYEIIKQDKKSMTTPVLFKEVCKLLEISEDKMYEMIGDFYTNLTTDKRFILLDDARWDLKEFHIVKTIIDEEDNETEVNDEQIEDEFISEESEDDAVMQGNDSYDDDDDELDDLSIVTEEELDE